MRCVILVPRSSFSFSPFESPLFPLHCRQALATIRVETSLLFGNVSGHVWPRRPLHYYLPVVTSENGLCLEWLSVLLLFDLGVHTRTGKEKKGLICIPSFLHIPLSCCSILTRWCCSIFKRAREKKNSWLANETLDHVRWCIPITVIDCR